MKKGLITLNFNEALELLWINRVLRTLALITAIIMSGFIANAQNLTVSGGTSAAGSYPSFAAALTAVNGATATGAIIINFDVAGYSETAPPTGFVIGSTTLNPTLSATNTLTISKTSGIITLNAGIGTSTPGSAAPDGIISLRGADFVTIDGLTLTDGNTTNPATMEFGIGMFKASVSDGCNNNTVQNCIINMQRVNNATATTPMLDGAVGIEVVNSTAIAATTSLIPTNGGTLATNGSNSGNKFYSNTINSGNIGIGFSGYAASTGAGPAPVATTFLGDLNNDIGGTLLTTGNTILNFGGGATTNPAAGIRANNQWSVNIQFNNINNNNGSGVNHATTLRGIYAQAGTSANATISNNTISIKAGGTTSLVAAIDNVIGTTAASNTITISNNTIQNCSYSTGTSATFSAIQSAATATTLNITGNIIQNNTYTGATTSGTFNGILNTSINTTTNINSNQVINNTIGTAGSANSCTMQLIYCNASSTNFNANSNTITGNTLANNFGTIYCIRAVTSTVTLDGNTISSNTIPNNTGGTSASIYGYYNASSPVIENFTNNNINNLTINGNSTATGHIIYGIYLLTATGAKTISGNNINNLSFTSSSTGYAAVTGIRDQYASTANIFKNVVHNLSSTGASPTVIGILFGTSAGTTYNVYNNIVGNLFAPQSTGFGIQGIYCGSSGTTYNVSYNTVYLNATSSASGSASAALYMSSTTPTTNLIDNIFINLSTGTTTWLSTAIRRTSTTLTAYGSTSNNNMVYAGTPSATNAIYYDGTNTDQTIAAFKTRVTPRETASFSENASTTPGVYFQSFTGPASGSSTTFLHFVNGLSSQCESGGITVAGIADDYDGNSRNASTPDVGADEFAGSAIPVPSISGFSPASFCSSGGASVSITGNNFSLASSVKFNGVNAASFIINNNTSISAVTPAGVTAGVITVTSAGGSATSTAYTVTPTAPISATTLNPSICAGGSTTLNVTSSNSGYTYTWMPGNLTGTSVTVTPATSTVYTVTGVDNSGGAFNGCSETGTVNITVNPNTLNVTATATPPSICQNGNSQLLALATSASGYTMNVNGSAPFVDISSSGTAVTGILDDSEHNLTLPFAFNFNGTSFTTARVGTNGALAFGSTTGDVNAGNSCLPISGGVGTAGTSNLLIPYWDDLDVNMGGTIKTQQIGNVFYIQWTGVDHDAFTTGNITFQIQLVQGTNAIHFVYSDVIFGSVTYDAGVNATIGIQLSGTSALQFSCNTASLTNGKCISFLPIVPSLSYDWSANASFLNSTTIANPLAQVVTSNQTYTVVVTDASTGCQRTATTTLTVQPLVVSANASTTSNCSGQTVTLNATVTGGGAPYTYSWNDGNGVVGTTLPLTVTPTLGSTTYTLTVTDACSGILTSSVTVNTIQVPTVAVTSNPSNATICVSGSVQLTASGASTYTWAPVAGLSATNIPNPTASPTATTTYTVTGTASGCSNTASITVLVVPNTIAASVTATPASVCPGGNSQLQVLATSASGYTMNTNGNATFVDISSSGTLVTGVIGDDTEHNLTLPFSFTFNGTSFTTARVGLNGGLAFGSTTGDVGLTNACLPVAAGVGTAGTSNLLLPYWDDLDVNMGGTLITQQIGNVYYIQWSGVDHNLFTTGNITFQIQLVQGTNEIHFVYSDVIFGSATYDAGLTGTIGIQMSPTSAIQFSCNTASLTNGKCISFLPNVPTFTYNWSANPSFLNSTTSANPLAQGVTSNQTYTVLVTDVNTGCQNTATTSVTVQPLAVSANASATSICTGQTVTLNATVSGGGAPYSYSWHDGNGVVGTTLPLNVNPSAGSTTYTLTVTDACSGILTSSVTINANQTPTVSVATNPSSGAICGSGSVQITASGATTYSWSPASGLSATNIPNPVASPTITTLYTVTGTTGGCSKTETVTITVIQNLNAIVTATPATTCAGSNSQLLASASLPGYTVNAHASAPFVDISTSGTLVTGILGDDSEHNLTLPFAFNFNGTNYTTARAGLNGALAFGSTTGEVDFVNACIPSTAAIGTAGTSNLLLPYWDDLDINMSGTIKTQQIGNVYYIQWTGVDHNAFTTGAITFQVQLVQGTNEVRFAYSDVIFGDAAYDAGVNATIGLQFSATSALSYSCNTASLTNGQCISFSPVAGNFTYDWSANPAFLNATNISNPIAQAITSNQNYSVLITDVISGCQQTANVTVTVPSVTITPASATLCEDDTVKLKASTMAANTGTLGTQAAQNTLTTYPAPYTAYFGGQRMQMLVTAAELAAAGFTAGSQFSGIQFPVVSMGANWGSSITSCNNFQISIGATSLTSISTFQSGLTQVVAPANFTPTIGYNNTHTFNAPFAWNGTSNIIIETTFSNNFFGAVSGVEGIIQYNTPTSYQSTISYRADNVTAAAAAAATTVSQSYNTRSDFKLIGTGNSAASWSPVTDLFEDEDLLIPYTGGLRDSVYSHPSATRTYTATAIVGTCTATKTVTVTVDVIPQVNITASGPTVYCPGSTVTLNASTHPTYVNYSWAPNGPSGAGANSFVVSGGTNTTTVYTVTATGAGGCTSHQQIPVTVYDTISPDMIPSTTNICTGAQASLQAQITGNLGPAQAYLWNTNETDSLIIISSGGTYSVVTTDVHGCATHGSQLITESPTPAPPVIVAQGDTNLCSNDDSQTWSTVDLHTVNYSSGLFWSTFNDFSQDITVFYPDNYFVIYTDPNTGCASQSNVISVTANYASTDPLNSQVSSNAPGNITCATPITLTLAEELNPNNRLAPAYLGTNAVWKWYLDGGSCGAGTYVGSGASIPVTPPSTPGPHTYYVRAEGFCNTTNCASIVITVKAPSVDPTGATASVSTLCAGGQTQLSVVGGSLGTGAQWKWYAGTCGGAPIGFGPSVFVNTPATTTYYVRAEGDCNTTLCQSTTVTVSTSSTDPTSASSNAPVNGICLGNPVTLTVSGGTLGTAAIYKWYEDGCGSGGVVGTGASITITPAVEGLHSYYVRAEGPCNTTNCVGVQVLVGTYSVEASGITSSVAGNSICTGNNITLTLDGGFLGTVAQWKWYSGTCGGVAAGTGTTITVNPAATTTYFVRAEGSCNNTICASMVVNVTNTAPSNPPPTITSAPNGICSGNGSTVVCQAVPGATFYSWSAPNGTTFDGNNPSPYITTSNTVQVNFGNLPNGVSGYDICVFAGNGCGNTVTKCRYIRGRVQSAQTITGNASSCPNTTSAYSIVSLPGADSYTWTITGAANINGGSATLTTTATTVNVNFLAGWTSGTLTVYGSMNCGYNGPAKTITIISTPVVPGVITGPALVCPSQTYNFSIAPVAGASGYNWSTNVPGAVIGAGTTSRNITFPAVIPAGSTVSVTATGSCGTSLPRVKNIATGLANAPGTITGPATGQCGQTTGYSILPVAGATSYLWTADNSATIFGLNNITTASVVFPVNSNPTTVSVVAINACGNSAPQTKVVIGAPASPGVINGSGAVCVGIQAYTYTVPGSTGATAYVWTAPAGALILTGQNTASVSILYNDNTGGLVTVYAQNACGVSSTSSLSVSVVCRQAQIIQGSLIDAIIYPNPTIGTTTLRFETITAGDYKVSVVDMTGQMMQTSTITAVEGMNMHEIDLSTYAKGLYMVRLERDGEPAQMLRVTVE